MPVRPAGSRRREQTEDAEHLITLTALRENPTRNAEWDPPAGGFIGHSSTEKGLL